MKNKDLVSIGNLYGHMLNSVKKTIRESAKNSPNAFEETPKLVGKGPNVDGYNKALNDEEDVYSEDEEDVTPSKRQKTTEKMKGRLNDPNLTKDQKKKLEKEIALRTAEEAEENEKMEESAKNAKKMLNNFMSNKSMFDKLYSKVLKENFGVDDQETSALGLDDATPDSDLGDVEDEGFGDEDEGDTVTFTLDRTTAQALVDVLQGALGGDVEGEGEGEGDELDFGDEGEGDEGEGDEFSFEEDEEVGTKPAPDKKKAFMGKDNKVAGPPKPKSGHAKTDVTDDTNTTNTAPPIKALQGKNNQVPGSTVKVGDYFK